MKMNINEFIIFSIKCALLFYRQYFFSLSKKTKKLKLCDRANDIVEIAKKKNRSEKIKFHEVLKFNRKSSLK